MKNFVKNRELKKWAAIVGGVLALQGATMQQVQAVPVLFNSNYYEFIEVSDPYTGNNNSWFTAQGSAAASSFMGSIGHLVTITSQAENDFLVSLIAGSFTGFTGAWIGGQNPAGWQDGPESGSAFTYTNWFGNEPNNPGGYAYMNIGEQTSVTLGGWLDDSTAGGTSLSVPSFSADPVVGYFVEYEDISAVPVPAGLPLFGTGIALLGILSWRKKRKASDTV